MNRRLIVSVAAAAALWTSTVMADALYGTCKYKDGSKADGTVTVSTSWNSKKAFPKNGQYRLDFGGTVGKTITVYVNGDRYTTIEVRGETRLDITVR